MKDVSEAVGQNIANLRKARKLTQGQLAERFNYTDKAISKWEHGDVCPDVNTLQELADFFGVTMDYMTHHHTEESVIEEHSKDPSAVRRNRLINTALVSVFFWTLAAVVFSAALVLSKDTPIKDMFGLGDNSKYLYASIGFVWALPFTSYTVFYYNWRWGKYTRRTPLSLVALWATVIAIYATVSMSVEKGWELWFILFLGIPLTVVFIFIGFNRRRKFAEIE